MPWASRLFPEPLEPTTAVTWPGRMAKVRSRITGRLSRRVPRSYWVKEMERCSACNRGSMDGLLS